jgi:hypothetical protein
MPEAETATGQSNVEKLQRNAGPPAFSERQRDSLASSAMRARQVGVPYARTGLAFLWVLEPYPPLCDDGSALAQMFKP